MKMILWRYGIFKEISIQRKRGGKNIEKKREKEREKRDVSLQWIFLYRTPTAWALFLPLETMAWKKDLSNELSARHLIELYSKIEKKERETKKKERKKVKREHFCHIYR